MKKVFLSAVAITLTIASFGQQKKTPVKFGWKIGLLTSLPADNDVPATRISLGSTFGDVTYPISQKITAIGNVAYIKYKDEEGKSFSQIPVMVGASYKINEMFHFGANAGLAFYNKSANSNANFIYTPFVGMDIKKISIDARYINTVKDEPIKVLALVFSYKL
jgi:hypothetical protein